MSFRKIKVEGKELNPTLSHEFAIMQPLPGEREERPSRHDYLLKAVKDGMFGGPSWARGIDKSTGEIYRLDGQHSSKMLSHLPDDVPFPTGLLVTIDTWEFDSIGEDGPAVFNLFNHPKSARTNEDAIGIYRASVVELKDIDRKFLLKIGNGIAEYESGLASKSAMVLPLRERGLYFVQNDKYAQFACWMAGFRETKNAAFLSRSPIIAEMLADWIAALEYASEFWEYVFKESHPDVDHDTRALAEAFRLMSMQKKHKAADYRKRARKAWKNYLLEIRAHSDPSHQESFDMPGIVSPDISMQPQAGA